MIYGMVALAAMIVVSALLFRKYGGQTGSQSTTDLAEYASYLRLSHASGKFWGAVALIVVLNLIVGFFSYNLASYGFQKSPIPLFLAVNLTALLWVVGLSLGVGSWAKFGMVVLSLILLQAGFGFSYGPSPGDLKAKAQAAKPRAEGTLPRSGEKVIMAPVGGYETFVIPKGSVFVWNKDANKRIEVRNLAGWSAIDQGQGVEGPGYKNLAERTMQFRSLEKVPVEVTLSWE